MPINITYLKPTWKDAYPAKQFKIINDIRVEVSNYKLGKEFRYKTDEVKSLVEAYRSIMRHGNAGWIRILGAPNFDLSPELTVTRRNVNFSNGKSKLIMHDLDMWAVPPELNWDISDPDSTENVIRTLLGSYGLNFLDDTDFFFLLSSNQWDNKELRAHIYHLVSEPVDEKALQGFGNSLKKLKGWKVFDPASYKLVQPDYIAPRECDAFDDPLPPAARIAFCSGTRPHVPIEEFQKLIFDTRNAAGFAPGQSTSVKLGATWRETCKFCGNPSYGINEPAHRAAAQMAKTIGRATILSNLTYYANSLQDAVWESVIDNDPYTTGSRNQRKDRETYNLARFTQYLTSVTKKEFTGSADEDKKLVEDAIDNAKNGNLSCVFEEPILLAYTRLKSNHPAACASIRYKFKNNLRGVVALSDFEKEVTAFGKKSWIGADGAEYNSENDFIEVILNKYRWIKDDFGQMWAGLPSENGYGGFQLTAIGTDLQEQLYYMGMDLSGRKVSERFGTKAVKFVLGEEAVHQETEKSRFERCHVGIRVYPVDGPYSNSKVTYIDIGKQPDGKSKFVKISDKEIKLGETKDCPIKWQRPKDFGPIVLAGDQEVAERFSDIEELKSWTLMRLFDFFNLQDEDRSPFIGALFAMISGRGMSPILEFNGSAASGKSSAGDLILDLIDPTSDGLANGSGRIQFNSVHSDQMVNVVASRYLTVFDNVSKLSVKWQDNFCQTATGISKEQRILYVGSYQKIYAKRPIVLSALETVVTRPDLETRKETMHFDGYRGFKIKTTMLAQEWTTDKPFLYVGLLHLLSDALTAVDRIPMQSGLAARRYWYKAADRLFGRPGYEKLLNDRDDLVGVEQVTNSSFAMLMVSWLYEKRNTGIFSFELVASELYKELREYAQELQGSDIQIPIKDEILSWRVASISEFPTTPRGLGWELNKFEHAIRRVSGWEYRSRARRTSKGIAKQFKYNQLKHEKSEKLVDKFSEFL
jgi:hypothetical protein